jgi:hypothetical protein
VPKVPASWKSCIYQGGTGAICPAGYPDQSIYYDAFQDTRACSTCTCGTPTGTCGGTVSVSSDAACNSEQQMNVGTCLIAPDAVRARYTSTGPTNVGCAPSTSNLSGSVAALNPVTFCCSP